MATGKQQDRNIFLRVLKPCRDPIRSWHSLQTFSPPAAVAPVAPNAWAPMHWALTSIGWLEVGPGACSAPSQVSKQVCAPSSAKELPPDPKHVPSTKKKKRKRVLWCRHWAQRAYSLHCYTLQMISSKITSISSSCIFCMSCVCSQRHSHTAESPFTNSQETALTSETLRVGWGQDTTGGTGQLPHSVLPPAHLAAIYRCSI